MKSLIKFGERKNLWKVLGVHLIILNLVLIVVFSGVLIEKKIVEKHSPNKSNLMLEKSFKIDYSTYNEKYQNIIIGNKNASFTILLFNDYECPYCRKFGKKIYEQIKEDFIDTGKAKMIIKNVPTVQTHKNSFNASMAVFCANEQEMAEEMHEELTKNKHPSIDNLMKLSQEIGLNETQFEECLQNETYKNEIMIDIRDSQMFEIKTTPTLIVGDSKVEGIKPYFVIKKVIDEEIEVNKFR